MVVNECFRAVRHGINTLSIGGCIDANALLKQCTFVPMQMRVSVDADTGEHRDKMVQALVVRGEGYILVTSPLPPTTRVPPVAVDRLTENFKIGVTAALRLHPCVTALEN